MDEGARVHIRRGRLVGGVVAAAVLAVTSTALVMLPAQGALLDTAQVGAARTAAVTVPSGYVSQTLTWKECFPGKGFPQLECALMRTPKDWNRPTGGGIGVVVSRVRSSDPAKRRGVLFTNPGGPGEPGLMLPLYLSLTETDVAAAYDIVGMDPRGAGNSTMLKCAAPSVLGKALDLDGRNASGAVQTKILAANKAYAAACGKSSYARVVNTFQTVRDVNLLRSLLRENKISYVGYSAGTWLGTWFAATFPSRVDRFVLDGNLEFTAPLYSSFARQPSAFQASFEKYFLPWAATYDPQLALGATGPAVKVTYEKRRAALLKAPLTLPDGTVLTASRYDRGVASALYWIGRYPDLGAALSIIEHWADATADDKKIVVDVFGGGGATDGGDAFWATVCGDSRNPSAATVLRDTATFRRSAPLIGANWNIDPCSYWPAKPLVPPMTGAKAPAMLMINNAADPATPLANARASRKKFTASRLITVSGQPDHTIFGEGATCVEDAARAWLLKGTLPKADLVCPGLPLPDPTAQPPAQPADQAPAAPSAGAVRSRTSSGITEERQRGTVLAAPAGVWTQELAQTIGEPAVDAPPN